MSYQKRINQITRQQDNITLVVYSIKKKLKPHATI